METCVFCVLYDVPTERRTSGLYICQTYSNLELDSSGRSLDTIIGPKLGALVAHESNRL